LSIGESLSENSHRVGLEINSRVVSKNHKIIFEMRSSVSIGTGGCPVAKRFANSVSKREGIVNIFVGSRGVVAFKLGRLSNSLKGGEGESPLFFNDEVIRVKDDIA